MHRSSSGHIPGFRGQGASTIDEIVTPQKKAGVQQFLEVNKAGGNVIATSVITHLEVIPAKLEAKNPGAAGQYLGMFDAKDFVEVEINRNILLRASEIRSSISAPPIRPMEWLRKLWIQPTPFIWRLPPSTARLNFTHATTIRRGARYLLSPFLIGAA